MCISQLLVRRGQIFPLVAQAIKHLTRLGLIVVIVTCDGASDNRRMFQMFNSKVDLSYKTVNIFRVKTKMLYFHL